MVLKRTVSFQGSKRKLSKLNLLRLTLILETLMPKPDLLNKKFKRQMPRNRLVFRLKPFLRIELLLKRER